jgi:uncharacterized membrane protein
MNKKFAAHVQEADLTKIQRQFYKGAMGNGAELHLVINHFPVILPIAGIAVLLAGLLLRSVTVLRVAYCLLLAGALFAVPTYFTGGVAESVAKNYPDVSRLIIREHQTAGKTAFALLGVMGLYSAGLFALSFRRTVSRSAMAFLLLLAFVSSAYVGYVAHLGGEIRHEEVRKAD